jgi:hypothetical protein
MSLDGVLGLPNLQGVYDATNGVPHISLVAGQPLTIRDNATPIGDVFILETNAGVDFFNVNPGQLAFGTAGDRAIEVNLNPAGKGGIRYMPDGRTVTALTTQAALQWDSLVIQQIPGGAPFGNDSAPAAIQWIGECQFNEPAFLFATLLLFNQGAIISTNGFNLGPLYTMINQPTVRSIAAGSFSCSQGNAVRSQPRIGPNTAGNLTQTTYEHFFATVQVDSTVGTVILADTIYFAAKAPILIGGGTVTVLTCLDLPNIPITGITTLTGIRSAMSAGTFINHTGIAPSVFAGQITLNSAVLLRFGTASGVQFSRTGAGILTQAGWGLTNNENLIWDHESTANVVALTSGSSAGLQLNLAELVIGSGLSPNGTNNWFLGVAPGARTTQLAGDYNDVLFFAGGPITVNHAITDLCNWCLNEPGITIGTGSISGDTAVLKINTVATEGTLNYAIKALVGLTGLNNLRVDGNIGFFGTTPVVQAAAYTPTNVTPDRSYDANSTTLDEIADVLGTLINDLQTYGLLQ